jgi:hypothetical protein
MDRSWILDSQLTRHDPNPVLTRLHPQTRKWAKQRFHPFDANLQHSMTWRWIAERLSMGTAGSAANGVRALERK